MTLHAWRRLFGVSALVAEILTSQTAGGAVASQCNQVSPLQIQIEAGQILHVLVLVSFLALVLEMRSEIREKLLCTALLLFGLNRIIWALQPTCTQTLPAGALDWNDGFLAISQFCFFALAILSIREIAKPAPREPWIA
jgi:hypothetical protein